MLTEIGVEAPISLEICSAELWAAPAEEAASEPEPFAPPTLEPSPFGQALY